MQKNVLFVSGIPDDDKVQVKKAHPNGDILRYVYTGLSEFFLYLEPSDWNRLPVLIDSREFPFQLDPATHCIINEIAEAVGFVFLCFVVVVFVLGAEVYD